MKHIKRIGVWSGPRNLSTALMRSFGSRNDFEILDEPFYAAYLKKTGIKHPMRDRIIRNQLSDYKEVSNFCINGIVNKPYQYQKHMTHHMINNDHIDFILSLKNVILIRQPESVLRSYKKKNKNYELKDLGFQQLYDLYKFIQNNLNYSPFIINAEDLQNNPESTLKKLCDNLEIPFCLSMLSWSPGPKEYDGVWGSHWYKEINSTSGFHKNINYFKTNLENKTLLKKDQVIIDEANKYYFRILNKK